jgi:hypothetical protein
MQNILDKFDEELRQENIEYICYLLARDVNQLALDCQTNPDTMDAFVNTSDGECYHEITAALETLRKLMEKAKAFKSNSKTSSSKSQSTKEDNPFEKNIH